MAELGGGRGGGRGENRRGGGGAPRCDAEGAVPELGAHVRAAGEHPEALPPRVARDEPLVVGIQREDDEAEVHEAQQREPPARTRATVSVPAQAGNLERGAAYQTELLNSGMGRAFARDSICFEAKDLTWYLFRASIVQPCSFRVMV